MPCWPEPTMPEGLDGFPWRDLLHVWDYDYGYRGLRLVLWYPPTGGDARTQATLAHSEHLRVWEWLEARHEVTRMPEFEALGDPCIKDGTQRYTRVAFVGTFTVAKPKTPAP